MTIIFVLFWPSFPKRWKIYRSVKKKSQKLPWDNAFSTWLNRKNSAAFLGSSPQTRGPQIQAASFWKVEKSKHIWAMKKNWLVNVD